MISLAPLGSAEQRFVLDCTSSNQSELLGPRLRIANPRRDADGEEGLVRDEGNTRALRQTAAGAILSRRW